MKIYIGLSEQDLYDFLYCDDLDDPEETAAQLMNDYVAELNRRMVTRYADAEVEVESVPSLLRDRFIIEPSNCANPHDCYKAEADVRMVIEAEMAAMVNDWAWASV